MANKKSSKRASKSVSKAVAQIMFTDGKRRANPASKRTPQPEAPAPPATPTINHPLTVGNTVLIRTVTHYHVGKIVLLDERDIVLEGASWVASTGRFNDALKSGKLFELEPFTHLVSVSRGAYVDATIWSHALPTEVV
jgi:hypothetical protein